MSHRLSHRLVCYFRWLFGAALDATSCCDRPDSATPGFEDVRCDSRKGMCSGTGYWIKANNWNTYNPLRWLCLVSCNFFFVLFTATISPLQESRTADRRQDWSGLASIKWAMIEREGKFVRALWCLACSSQGIAHGSRDVFVFLLLGGNSSWAFLTCLVHSRIVVVAKLEPRPAPRRCMSQQRGVLKRLGSHLYFPVEIPFRFREHFTVFLGAGLTTCG